MIEQDRVRAGVERVVESTPRYSRFSVILMPSSDSFEFYTGTIVEVDGRPLFGGRALELNGVARDFTESADELGALIEAGVEEIPIEEWMRLSRTGDVNWQVRMPCDEHHYMEDLIN